jgi:hypothetical protein
VLALVLSLKLIAAQTGSACVHDWASCFDLDGDGRADQIEVGFSGGAHCCYTIGVELASGKRIALPFELDGGYARGFDLSQPGRFAIRPGPELEMLIGTSGAAGEGDPLGHDGRLLHRRGARPLPQGPHRRQGLITRRTAPPAPRAP